jgi:hypothetical protein
MNTLTQECDIAKISLTESWEKTAKWVGGGRPVFKGARKTEADSDILQRAAKTSDYLRQMVDDPDALIVIIDKRFIEEADLPQNYWMELAREEYIPKSKLGKYTEPMAITAGYPAGDADIRDFKKVKPENYIAPDDVYIQIPVPAI